MSYEPLYHKYRPQTFADLVGQEAIATTLSFAIKQRKIAPAYLFTGPRGTGKTSSARILAKSLNCLSSDRPTPSPCGQCEVCQAIARGSALDVMEIDAASNTGVDNIREIIERCQFAPVQSRYKVYAIDECHMLSTAAFNALLKTLEEPPDRVIFVLATTDPQRVLSTIISRCQRFDFRRISLAAMVSHLKYIATQENISITDEAITLVAQIANGGLRDAESLLDQLSLLPEIITVEQVWDLVGSVPEQDLLALLRAIASERPEAVIDRCRKLLDRGREPLIVLQNLAGFYLNLLIAKTAPNHPDLTAVTETTWQNLCTQAQKWDTREILRGQQHLKETEVQLKNTTQPRLWLEVTLLGLLPLSSDGDRADKVFSSPTAIVKPPEPNTVTTPQKSEPIPSNSHTSSSQKSTSSCANSATPIVESVTTPNPALRTPNSEVLAVVKPCGLGRGFQDAEPASAHSLSASPPSDSALFSSRGTPEGFGSRFKSTGLSGTRTKFESQSVAEGTSVEGTVEPFRGSHRLSQVPNPKSELQTPNSLANNISPQEIWKKAIDHLHPPTTQALFKQKCHLISLEGSVAIVGIRSPQLLKLNQGKIPNLEAAFAKACQRTIKVKLEVSTAESPPVISVSPSVQLPAVQAPVSPPIYPPSTTSSADSRESSTATPEKKTLTPELKTPQPETRTDSHPTIELNRERYKTQREEKQQEKVIPLRENLDEIPKQTELSPVTLSAETIPQNYNSSDIDENLQKAVEALAKNFEGEVVTLAGVIDKEAEEMDLEESLSAQLLEQKNDDNASEYKLEHLSTQELEANHISSNINQSSLTPTPIIHNRPDLSTYEDEDDVPF